MDTWIVVTLGIVAFVAVFAIVYSLMQRATVRRFERESLALRSHAGQPPVVTEEMLTRVPPAAADWIRRSGAVGKSLPVGSVSRATLELRTGTNARWNTSRVEMVNRFWPHPATAQLMRSRVGPLPVAHLISLTTHDGEPHLSASAGATIVGRDVLIQTLIAGALGGVWTDSPAALALLPIQWEVTGERSVAATLTVGGRTARVEANFAADGDLSDITFLMPEPLSADGVPTRAVVIEIREVDGYRIAVAPEAHQFRKGEWFQAQRGTLEQLGLLRG